MTQRLAITYSRVSTGRQAESGISLDDQDQATKEAITRAGWQLGQQFVDAGKSAKSITGRPELKAALAMLASGQAQVLVVAKLDRLTRSTVGLCEIMNQAQKQGWALVVLDLGVDTSTPTGELLASVVGTVAHYERRLIGERARMTHANRKAKGLRAGAKPLLPQSLRLEIAAKVASGETLAAIAEALNKANTPTAKGGRWYPSTVAHVARSVALDQSLAAVVS